MDIRRYAHCHPRFFCPNAGNGFEDIPKLQKGRYEHECKKRSQESLTSKRKPMEIWRQYQKLNQSAQKHCPVIRAPVIPRRTRRGC